MNPPPSTPDGGIPTVAWRAETERGWPGVLELIDQTRLPAESVALACEDVEAVRDAIQRLCVRGAPAIGVAAAYGLVVALQGAADADPARFDEAVAVADERLRTSRPTAVNLGWALDRCRARLRATRDASDVRLDALLAEARAIHAEDEAACAAMGRHAQELVRDGGTYLTHCNTGRFATAGIGTAFGVFATARHSGRDILVYACEVRPLLQGSRLTTYELMERGIAGRLLPDSAAGSLLRGGRVEAVFVGADRIARNGDAANKIGTYPLAELARAAGVPFYVVAPTSTIDATLSDGSLIPIEERAADEVLGFRGQTVAPEGFPVWNPAFDVTPAHLISAIVTEHGVARAPYGMSLGPHLSRA